jgi:hypothetical protein
MRSLKKKGSGKKLAECDLCSPVRRFLGREGCDRVIRELRFFDRSIDLYGVAWGIEGKTIAVELKLRKWQKALQQAALYQLCSDYSYVAMPWDRAKELKFHFFQAAGVGILAVDMESKVVDVLLPAVLSRETKQHYVGTYKDMLRR